MIPFRSYNVQTTFGLRLSPSSSVRYRWRMMKIAGYAEHSFSLAAQRQAGQAAMDCRFITYPGKHTRPPRRFGKLSSGAGVWCRDSENAAQMFLKGCYVQPLLPDGAMFWFVPIGALLKPGLRLGQVNTARSSLTSSDPA